MDFRGRLRKEKGQLIRIYSRLKQNEIQGQAEAEGDEGARLLRKGNGQLIRIYRGRLKQKGIQG